MKGILQLRNDNPVLGLVYEMCQKRGMNEERTAFMMSKTIIYLYDVTKLYFPHPLNFDISINNNHADFINGIFRDYPMGEEG